MKDSESAHLLTRRHALALGGGLAASGLASGVIPAGAGAAARHGRRYQTNSGSLPVSEIERIVQAQGTVTNGVLTIGISRDDIGKVRGPLGVTFDGSFEIDGSLTFQPIADNRVFFNGDIPVKPEEANHVIDEIQKNDLIFQAFHQHYIEFSPNVWFIHFRGHGEPRAVATCVHNVLKVTSTPLPQTLPQNPKTPFDAKRLGDMLHGDAQVGNEGVVTVTVDRTDRIVIDGIVVNPEANISTNIEFKPLDSTGKNAAAAPDFSMTSAETTPVIHLMRLGGWFVGCLYNQETNETPQLFFSHMLKVGDPYVLAQQIRRGLDLTNAK